MTAAYLHIPFCEHICFYCDFNKVFLEGQPVDEYVDAVIKEMAIMKSRHPKEAVSTFYIGGGTPTTLTAKQLDKLLDGVQTYFPLDKNAEFTVEANPESVSFEKFAVMKSHGVNRISMGVQSFNNEILKKIGRIHTAEQVYDCVANADKAGFDNISIDLIFRLPNQTIEDFTRTLQKALELDLPHYSIYALILENKTIFYNLMRQGKLPLPSEDDEADMFQLAMETMEKAGRYQYEISNYAKPGFQSQHNLAYWNNDTYFGFGAGAHGYIDGVRYNNHGPIQHFLEPLRQGESPIIYQNTLSKQNKMEEEMILGLRTMRGIDQTLFKTKYGQAVEEIYQNELTTLFNQKLIKIEGDYIRLTKKGVFLGNEVFRSFLMDN
ncbi:radical SAM family heme chaperone HemW [Jeotgalibaca ciconiae]|uniref:Heme chaperone HemW n=1 Tax=Jeotgalibaca ciconiae TaxID=2496265 RepID=A0A3Q9BN64_9LACT|nr:radical SAM family heme chaperone HemW [Jeotgalibaca ciconiae]AZP05335.1 oxygen-independent coproporphyrinogen III oxidase [Jeotgalibaca ciconiae]